MDAHLEPIGPDPGSSFCFLDRSVRAFGLHLHHHELVELNVITRGEVTAVIGDHTGHWRAPAAFLVGSDLPHTWVSRPGVPAPHRCYVLQFSPALVARLHGLPEALALERVLARARGALALDGAPAAALAARLAGFRAAGGPARLALLLDALQVFADADPRPLSSRAAAAADPGAAGRLAAVCAWLEANAEQPVSLAGAARVAGMHPQALARFFRRHTGHSVIGWVQRLRVARACELLRRGGDVAGCAAAVGLSGTAHFHRVFRRIMAMSPAEYRRLVAA